MLIFGGEFGERVGVVEAFCGEALAKRAEFVEVKDEKEAVFANFKGVKFGVCSGVFLAKKLQSLANDYLFDMRILVRVASESEFEEAICARIDGVIFV